VGLALQNSEDLEQRNVGRLTAALIFLAAIISIFGMPVIQANKKRDIP
jgi:hypothetical protein